jgi:serine/threonine-protein kinase HipA
MATVLDVCMGESGIPVGTLSVETQGSREFSRFVYLESWLEAKDAFAIAPTMPLTGDPMFFRMEGERGTPLPRAIADTSPDSWGRNIIRRDAKTSRSDSRPIAEVDYLLAVDDFSRIGALRFRRRGNAHFLSAAPEGRHEVPPLLKLGELGQSIAAIERSEPMTAKALRRLRQVGSALGGARPKCSVIDKDGKLLVAKFTSRDDTADVETMEVITLRLAAICGLHASVARLDKSDDLPVALVTRFDRGRGRRPYVSAQTFLGARDALSGTYVDIAEAMRVHSFNPKQDMSELFNRLAFTILVSNVDDHLKNHGFLHQGRGKWSLSPLFDVNPSPDRHRELKTHISEYSGAGSDIDALVEHADYFDIDPDDAALRIGEMARSITSSWVRLSEQFGMASRDIAHYRPAFEHDEMKKALRFDRRHG